MCSKRSSSVLSDNADQQENQPKINTNSLSQHTSKQFASTPKANEGNVLGESFSTQHKNNISKFEESWLALSKSDQSLIDSSNDTSWMSSPVSKRRAKALPVCFNKNSPRTPPGISRSRLSSSSFQTSRRWNALISEESCQPLKRNSSLTSPLMADRSPQIISSSFKTSRLWSELVSEESSQTINKNSPRTSSEQPTRSPRRLSYTFKTSQRWNDLMSDHLLNESICTDISDNDESLPVIRLVPDQPSQYLPSSSQKRVNPKPQIRAIKGGYAASFQRLLKSVRMDQRHLSGRKATHKVQVVAITKEFNVSMALVKAENQQGSQSSSFNILLQSKQAENVKVGSKLQFYLDANVRPLRLPNLQLVYCQPLNVVVLKDTI